MSVYYYFDNNDGHALIASVCASTITLADELFTKITGINPAKAGHIGCQVVPPCGAVLGVDYDLTGESNAEIY